MLITSSNTKPVLQKLAWLWFAGLHDPQTGGSATHLKRCTKRSSFAVSVAVNVSSYGL
jgi:hypothetical protein